MATIDLRASLIASGDAESVGDDVVVSWPERASGPSRTHTIATGNGTPLHELRELYYDEMQPDHPYITRERNEYVMPGRLLLGATRAAVDTETYFEAHGLTVETFEG